MDRAKKAAIETTTTKQKEWKERRKDKEKTKNGKENDSGGADKRPRTLKIHSRESGEVETEHRV